MTDEKPQPDRLYLSEAYLVEVESKTYGLYRDLKQDVRDERTGKVETRVLRKMVGPIGLFRPCEGDEKPDLRSGTDVPLNLKKISS